MGDPLLSPPPRPLAFLQSGGGLLSSPACGRLLSPYKSTSRTAGSERRAGQSRAPEGAARVSLSKGCSGWLGSTMGSAIEASPLTCPSCPNPAGFLQRNNSLEDKSRLVSALKERQSSRNLLACENSEKEGRFQKTETDFSNLYARGKVPILSLWPSPAAPSPGSLPSLAEAPTRQGFPS